jgi:hypothetical protein
MSTWWSRLKALTRRLAAGEKADRALDEEIQAYLREDIDARIRSGDSPEEARRAALAEVGGVEQVKERVRDVRTGAWLDALLQDVRYGVRTLVKTPDYSLSVVGSLSLGIASVITAVAFANGIAFRPFPGVRDQRELVEVRIEECFHYHYTLQRPADGRSILPLHRAAGARKQSRTGQGSGRGRRPAHSGP